MTGYDLPSEESMHTASQCWCDPRTSDREMDVDLATVFAEKLDQFRAPTKKPLSSTDRAPDF